MPETGVRRVNFSTVRYLEIQKFKISRTRERPNVRTRTNEISFQFEYFEFAQKADGDLPSKFENVDESVSLALFNWQFLHRPHVANDYGSSRIHEIFTERHENVRKRKLRTQKCRT